MMTSVFHPKKSKKERKQWKIKREKLVERSREAIY